MLDIWDVCCLHWSTSPLIVWCLMSYTYSYVSWMCLVFHAGSEDHRQRAHHGTESLHLKKLEQPIRSCGVCFQIWQNREPTGKPIPGSFDWTPLSGKHKLQVLKHLPAKMDTILEESIAPSVAKLWNVSQCFHCKHTRL